MRQLTELQCLQLVMDSDPFRERCQSSLIERAVKAFAHYFPKPPGQETVHQTWDAGLVLKLTNRHFVFLHAAMKSSAMNHQILAHEIIEAHESDKLLLPAHCFKTKLYVCRSNLYWSQSVKELNYWIHHVRR